MAKAKLQSGGESRGGKPGSGERRLPACRVRQLAECTMFAASCRELQAGSLRSPAKEPPLPVPHAGFFIRAQA